MAIRFITATKDGIFFLYRGDFYLLYNDDNTTIDTPYMRRSSLSEVMQSLSENYR